MFVSWWQGGLVAGWTWQGAGEGIESVFTLSLRARCLSCCGRVGAYQSSGPSSVALSMVRKYVLRLEWWSYMRAVKAKVEANVMAWRKRAQCVHDQESRYR